MIDFFTRKKAPPVILPAKPSDAPIMAALHDSAFARGWSDGEIQNLLADDHVMGLVAHKADAKADGKSVVGFVLIRWVLDEAEILTIAVSSSARRAGIGQALMDEALRQLYALRIAALFLEVEENNEAAKKLYLKMGFKQVGKRQNYYSQISGHISGLDDGAGGSALVMRRDLR